MIWGEDGLFHLISFCCVSKFISTSTFLLIQGPVACTINADPLRDYEEGILDDDTASTSTNHIVSIVGFGKDEETGKDYWIIRNSWGEYWGVSIILGGGEQVPASYSFV